MPTIVEVLRLNLEPVPRVAGQQEPAELRSRDIADPMNDVMVSSF